MPQSNLTYPERLQYGVPRALKKRLLSLAKRRAEAPGELFRRIVERGIENLERTEQAQHKPRNMNNPDRLKPLPWCMAQEHQLPDPDRDISTQNVGYDLRLGGLRNPLGDTIVLLPAKNPVSVAYTAPASAVRNGPVNSDLVYNYRVLREKARRRNNHRQQPVPTPPPPARTKSSPNTRSRVSTYRSTPDALMTRGGLILSTFPYGPSVLARMPEARIRSTTQEAVVLAGSFVVRLTTSSTQKMDTRPRWLDNVFVERFWRSLKVEEINLPPAEARECIADYIRYFNDKIHIGVLTSDAK